MVPGYDDPGIGVPTGGGSWFKERKSCRKPGEAESSSLRRLFIPKMLTAPGLDSTKKGKEISVGFNKC